MSNKSLCYKPERLGHNFWATLYLTVTTHIFKFRSRWLMAFDVFLRKISVIFSETSSVVLFDEILTNLASVDPGALQHTAECRFTCESVRESCHIQSAILALWKFCWILFFRYLAANTTIPAIASIVKPMSVIIMSDGVFGSHFARMLSESSD